MFMCFLFIVFRPPFTHAYGIFVPELPCPSATEPAVGRSTDAFCRWENLKGTLQKGWFQDHKPWLTFLEQILGYRNTTSYPYHMQQDLLLTTPAWAVLEIESALISPGIGLRTFHCHSATRSRIQSAFTQTTCLRRLGLTKAITNNKK